MTGKVSPIYEGAAVDFLMLYVFMTGVAALSGTIVCAVVFARSDRRYALSCIKVGMSTFGVCVVAIGFFGAVLSAQDAHRLGFESALDRQDAARAHFTDGRLWQLEKRKRSAQAATDAERMAKVVAKEADELSAEQTAALQAAEAAALKAEAEERRANAERIAREEADARKAAALAEQNAKIDAEARKVAEAAIAKARAEELAKAQRDAEARRAAEATRAQAEADARAKSKVEAEARAAAEAEAAQASKAQAEAEAAQLAAREEDETLFQQSTDRSMILFKAALKDASSADLQGLRVVRLPAHRAALCGVVNAKNSFGSYVGFRRFVVSADLQVAQFEGLVQDASFDSAWTNWCDR